jgi:hypothetical protein
MSRDAYVFAVFAPGEDGAGLLQRALRPPRFNRSVGKHIAVAGGRITAAEWVGQRAHHGPHLVLGLSDGCVELHTRKGR